MARSKTAKPYHRRLAHRVGRRWPQAPGRRACAGSPCVNAPAEPSFPTQRQPTISPRSTTCWPRSPRAARRLRQRCRRRPSLGRRSAARLVGQASATWPCRSQSRALPAHVQPRANRFGLRLAAAAQSAYHLHREAVAAIPQASGGSRALVDFAWASVHGHHPGPGGPARRPGLVARIKPAALRHCRRWSSFVVRPRALAESNAKQQGRRRRRRPGLVEAPPTRRRW